MGTRANIFISDGHQTMILYRHNDGRPSSVMPDLNDLALLKSGTKPLWGTSRLAQHLIKHYDEYQPANGLSWDVDYCYFVRFTRERGVYDVFAKEFNYVSEGTLEFRNMMDRLTEKRGICICKNCTTGRGECKYKEEST